jgi:hypothetical protein
LADKALGREPVRQTTCKEIDQCDVPSSKDRIGTSLPVSKAYRIQYTGSDPTRLVLRQAYDVGWTLGLEGAAEVVHVRFPKAR